MNGSRFRAHVVEQHVKKVEASAKKEGKVLKQTPRPGKVLAPGSRVRIKVGK